MPAKRAPVRAVSAKEDKRVRDPFIDTINGVEISLPSLTWIKPGFLRRTRHLPPAYQQFALMEEHLSEEQFAVLDELDPEEFDEFQDRWKAHSGIDLGE